MKIVVVSENAKTTYDCARELLADVDCPLDWPICRACGKRCDPGKSVRTGVTQLDEGCFAFHEDCHANLTPQQAAETNKRISKLFGGR